jgi:hypothetical protein
VTDDTFATDRIVQIGWFVAVYAIQAVYQEPVIVCIAVPGITGEGAVEPVRRVEGRTSTVTAHGIRRTGNTGNTAREVVPMAVHAKGTFRRGILPVSCYPTVRMVARGVNEAQWRVLVGSGAARQHGSKYQDEHYHYEGY